MATDHPTGDTAPIPTPTEALMVERQRFWAQFCRAALWAVIAVAVILVLLDWTLL